MDLAFTAHHQSSWHDENGSLDFLEPTPLAATHCINVVTDPRDIDLLRRGLGAPSSLDANDLECISFLFQQQRKKRQFEDEKLPHFPIYSGATRLARPNRTRQGDILLHLHLSGRETNPLHQGDPAPSREGMLVMPMVSSSTSRSDDLAFGTNRGLENILKDTKQKIGENPPFAEATSLALHDRADRRWMDHYHDLQAFFRTHGHSNVPSKYPPNLQLGFWTKRTRSSYKAYLQGKPSNITRERADLLQEVSFEWGRQELTWQSQFQKLEQFRQGNGHLRIPYASLEDRPLFYWLKRQRKLMRLHREGQEGPLSDDRYHRLVNLGVDA